MRYKKRWDSTKAADDGGAAAAAVAASKVASSQSGAGLFEVARVPVLANDSASKGLRTK